MRIQISVAAMLLSLSAVSQAAMFEPVPEPTIAPQDQAKVELGKMLWFDPRLSKSGFISCNSCHNLSTGGVDNLKTLSDTVGSKAQLIRPRFSMRRNKSLSSGTEEPQT